MSIICKHFVSQQSLEAGSTCICVCLYLFLWIPSLLTVLATLSWSDLDHFTSSMGFWMFLVCYRLWVSWRRFDWQLCILTNYEYQEIRGAVCSTYFSRPGWAAALPFWLSLAACGWEVSCPKKLILWPQTWSQQISGWRLVVSRAFWVIFWPWGVLAFALGKTLLHDYARRASIFGCRFLLYIHDSLMCRGVEASKGSVLLWCRCCQIDCEYLWASFYRKIIGVAYLCLSLPSCEVNRADFCDGSIVARRQEEGCQLSHNSGWLFMKYEYAIIHPASQGHPQKQHKNDVASVKHSNSQVTKLCGNIFRAWCRHFVVWITST